MGRKMMVKLYNVDDSSPVMSHEADGWRQMAGIAMAILDTSIFIFENEVAMLGEEAALLENPEPICTGENHECWTKETLSN